MSWRVPQGSSPTREPTFPPTLRGEAKVTARAAFGDPGDAGGQTQLLPFPTLAFPAPSPQEPARTAGSGVPALPGQIFAQTAKMRRILLITAN